MERDMDLARKFDVLASAGEAWRQAFELAAEQSQAAFLKYSIPRAPSYPDTPPLLNVGDFRESGSAEDFVLRLQHHICSWKKQLPEDAQPVVLAVLPGGRTIHVTSLGCDGHSLLRLEGVMAGIPIMLLAHHAAVQVVCYINKDVPFEERRTIGFSTGGEAEDARNQPSEATPDPAPRANPESPQG